MDNVALIGVTSFNGDTSHEDSTPNYAIENIIGGATNDATKLITLEEAQAPLTYEGLGWDFNTVWGIDPNVNGGYPYLRIFGTAVQTTVEPPSTPTTEPTMAPTAEPTATPTAEPTVEPTGASMQVAPNAVPTDTGRYEYATDENGFITSITHYDASGAQDFVIQVENAHWLTDNKSILNDDVFRMLPDYAAKVYGNDWLTGDILAANKGIFDRIPWMIKDQESFLADVGYDYSGDGFDTLVLVTSDGWSYDLFPSGNNTDIALLFWVDQKLYTIDTLTNRYNTDDGISYLANRATSELGDWAIYGMGDGYWLNMYKDAQMNTILGQVIEVVDASGAKSVIVHREDPAATWVAPYDVKAGSAITNTSTDAVTGGVHTDVIPDGYVGIYTAKDLGNIRKNLSGKYVLMADIDLSTWGNWTPIGSSYDTSFGGIFDGNWYTISNLTIKDTYTGNNEYIAGLFGYVLNGEIRNLGMRDTDIEISAPNASIVAGSIACCTNVTSIENCFNTGKIYCQSGSQGAIAGGIYCYDEGMTNTSNCYNTGSVSTVSTRDVYIAIGGISGDLNSGTIDKCYNLVDMSAELNTPGRAG